MRGITVNGPVDVCRSRQSGNMRRVDRTASSFPGVMNSIATEVVSGRIARLVMMDTLVRHPSEVSLRVQVGPARWIWLATSGSELQTSMIPRPYSMG